MGYYVRMDGCVKNVDPSKVSDKDIAFAEQLFEKKYNVKFKPTDRGKLENIIDEALTQIADFEVYDGDDVTSFFDYNDKYWDDIVTNALNALVESKLITSFDITCTGEDDTLWAFEYDSAKDKTWREVEVRKYSKTEIDELIKNAIEQRKNELQSFAKNSLSLEKGTVEFQFNETQDGIYLNFVPKADNANGWLYTFAEVTSDADNLKFRLFEDTNTEKPSHEASISIVDMFNYCGLI